MPAYVQRTSRQPEWRRRQSPGHAEVVAVYAQRRSRRPQAARHRSQIVAVPWPFCAPYVTSAQAEQAPVPRPCRALFPSMSNTSRRPKLDRRQSQDRIVPCIRLCPDSVAPAHVEHALIPRSRRTPYPSSYQESIVHRILSTESIVSIVTQTQPNSHRPQYRSGSGPYTTKNVTPARAEQALVPKTVPFSTSRERHAGPSIIDTGPKPCRLWVRLRPRERRISPPAPKTGRMRAPATSPTTARQA